MMNIEVEETSNVNSSFNTTSNSSCSSSGKDDVNDISYDNLLTSCNSIIVQHLKLKKKIWNLVLKMKISKKIKLKHTHEIQRKKKSRVGKKNKWCKYDFQKFG